MKKLNREAFEHAAAFVRGHARAVDQRLFDYYFTDGAADAVCAAVAAYQNSDGGFGHSLEPDFRLEASSPLATTVGFQYLRNVGASSNQPLVQTGIAYFVRTFDAARERWEKVPPEVNHVPRAFWWEYDESAAAQPGFQPNPGAEIVGYLHAYRTLVPTDFLYQATDLALRHLETQPDALEMHDALCYQRLAENLPEPQKSEAWDKLRRAAAVIVPRNPDEWTGYTPTPLLFAPSPQSPLASVFGDTLLEHDLDRLIERQTPEGCWSPAWSWGRYEDIWKTAEREWQGFITVQTLKTLADYGRIAPL